MVEVGLVNVEIHHTGVRTTNLCDVRIAEAATHLCCTAPVPNLCLYFGVTTLYDTRNHCRTLAGTVQVGYHLTNGATGIELAEPGGDIGLGIVWSQLLLYVDNDDRNIEISDGRQHIIRGTIGEHLQDDEVNVCCAELVASSHRLLLAGHHTAVDNLDGVGQRLLECLILSLKLRNELGELWQVSLQRNAEDTYPCFGFY